MAIKLNVADTTSSETVVADTAGTTDTTEVVTETTETTTSETTETTPPETTEPTKTVVSLGPVEFLDKTPCNWAITENEEGIVEATNLNTGEKFVGNLEDFNASLRG